MRGGMQHWPLVVTSFIDHAAREHGEREIVGYWADGTVERSNWAAIHFESRRLAQVLLRLGIAKGDRVATLAMNHISHETCWYGIAGMGGVMHTVNPRLFDEQIVYIINHAQDRVLLFDYQFLPIVERLRDRLPTIERFILFDGPETPNYLHLKSLLSEENGEFTWADCDERDPCGLCYTSGTTGNPKGVLYQHRSNVLHALAEIQPDSLCLSSRSVVLPVVPMFHANGWGVAYAAAAVGAKLVLSATNDAETLWRLIREEGVTHSAGVPTVWLSLFTHMDENGGDFGSLKRAVIGGSAAPRSMIERLETAGVEVQHVWGMTETSPIGTVGTRPANWDALSTSDKVDHIGRQGSVCWGVELRIVDDEDKPLPRDGKTSGRLQIKGHWVIERYFDAEVNAADADGWFDTGDVAIIHPNGTMQITDRAKDVIKSGGEWISSIELENAAVGCAGVAEAAAIGVPHLKWDERPILLVVRKQGSQVTDADIRAHLALHVAKWWLPDEVLFVDSLPHTATGKLLKRQLKEDYRDYKLATVD